MRNVENFDPHYIAAIYKTALAALRCENYKNMSYQASKTFLLDLAEDNNVPSNFFDCEFTMLHDNVLLEAIDIVTFYTEVADNTLLKVNKKLKKDEYVKQVASVYKAIAELTSWNTKLDEYCNVVLGMLHYELYAKPKLLNKAS